MFDSTAEWTPPAVEDWRSGLDTTGEVQISGDKTIDSPELNVREVEES